MKTLRAFWHWIDNDKPTEIRRDKLSKVALVALCVAESQVATRAFGPSSWSVDCLGLWAMCSMGDGSAEDKSRPEFFRPELVAAVRELSLTICPALEAMHAAVPEAKPKPVVLDSTFMTKQRLGGREYSLLAFDEMKEWIPPTMPTDTFRTVDRGREDRRLSGVRVPRSFRLRPSQSLSLTAAGGCPCGDCRAARREAALQADYLGIPGEAVKVATHDGLVPLLPDAGEPPSPEMQQAATRGNDVSDELRAIRQERNEYELRALGVPWFRRER